MRRNSSPFKWRRYAPDVILLCVTWYCRYQLSYRDIEEMMREHSKMSGASSYVALTFFYGPRPAPSSFLYEIIE